MNIAMPMHRAARALVGLSLLLSFASYAQVPNKIGYQGRLVKTDGTPETGPVQLTFSIFAAPTGGTALWTENQTLSLVDGFYATFLGDASPNGCSGSSCTGIPPALFDGSEKYLEVSVNGTTLTPRQRLAAVPYAVKATEARNVVGGTVAASSISASSITLQGGGISVNGTPVVDSSGSLKAHTHVAADVVSGVFDPARIPSHQHDASDVATGVLNVARLPTHTHSAADITSGVLAVARLPVHTHSAADITSGVLNLAQLPTHTHSAADITSGVLAVARLPTHTHSGADITSGTVAAARIQQGAGSTLDADTVDGLDSTSFMRTVERIPAGVVQQFAGATAPTGYLLCDGTPVSRTTYAALFTAIGTTYGAGDGSTTFNLPDLRGRLAVGKGTAAQVSTLGANDGLNAPAQVATRKIAHQHGKGTISASGGNHAHSINDPGHMHTMRGEFGSPGGGWGAFEIYGPGSQDLTAHGYAAQTGISINGNTHSHPNSEFSGNVGDTTGPTEGPAFLVLNYIIKY